MIMWKSEMINLDQIHWTFKFILHMYGDDADDDSSRSDNLNNNFSTLSSNAESREGKTFASRLRVDYLNFNSI